MKLTYEQTIAKIKQAAEKREARLKKRLQLEKSKPRKVKFVKVKPQKKRGYNALKDDLKIITHKIVRLQSDTCYTCGTYLEYKQRQAGHFWTVGGHQATRFDFDNIRVQCDQCNRFKSGNLAPYAVRLLAELGQERFYRLAAKARTTHKWERSELEQMIIERAAQLKELEA